MEPTTVEDQDVLAGRVVATMMERDAFSQWLGISIVSVKQHAVTIEMVIREDMLNGFGVCHGGISFSFADSALAFAANTHGSVTVAIENSIAYPTSIASGDVLTAEAIQESARKRLAFYRVTVRRGDEVVALFRGTVYRTDRELLGS